MIPRTDAFAPFARPLDLRALALGTVLALAATVLTACGGGGGGGGSDTVTISGRVTYDRVPFGTAPDAGLDYAATSQQPVREAVVQFVVGIGGGVLATGATDGNGNYSLSVPANSSGFVRVRAQSLRTTAPTRDIEVRDNTTSGSPVYVLDGSVFNSGTANVTRNLHAASGWDGSSYAGVRAAAPFAILDSMVSSVRFLLDNGNASTSLPPLDVYWSPLNTLAVGDVTLGQIGGTRYYSASGFGPPAGIYVGGAENLDTDEYDPHVLVHEFHHFLEDAITRSESPGGDHSINERLDLRLAFSEGFANAFSAMVLNDPIYRDSLGPQQSQGFSLDFEFEDYIFSPAGWYNEGSIISLVWDLYDTAVDGADNVALGYQPMFEVLTGPLNTTPALTSIYPFVTALRARAGAPVAAINTLVASQLITANDAWATGENNSGGVPEALPIYTTVALGGSQVVCGVTTAGTFNKIGNLLFLRFTLGSARTTTIRVEYTAAGSLAPFSPVPNPDFFLYRQGLLDFSNSTVNGLETLTLPLEAGEYVIEVYDYSHVVPGDSPPRGRTCFNVTVN